MGKRKKLSASIKEFHVKESTKRGTGFGAEDKISATVHAVIEGDDAEKVGRAMLQVAHDLLGANDG